MYLHERIFMYPFKQRMNEKDEKLVSRQNPGEIFLSRTTVPWQTRTVISSLRDCYIELLHHTSDPSTWIVRRWKKLRWYKERISSEWFTNEQQAYAYAYEMKKKYNRHHDVYDVRDL
jgi:hypothetical protein